MKTIAFGLAAFLIVGLTAAYGADKKDDNKTKIVGVWEVVKGEAPKGATMEFTKDGKLKFTVEVEGKKVTVEGTYEVDGESIKTVGKGPDGKEHKETAKIKKLTDKELVIEDEKGKTDEFKRAEKSKDKDKDK
jgi:uncharacterized protein (TIGR03066 family)